MTSGANLDAGTSMDGAGDGYGRDAMHAVVVQPKYKRES